MCGQNVEFVNVKHGGTYSNHWAVYGFCLCSVHTRLQSLIPLTPMPISHCYDFPCVKDNKYIGRRLAVFWSFSVPTSTEADLFRVFAQSHHS